MADPKLDSPALLELLAGGKRGETPSEAKAPTLIGDVARVGKKAFPYTPLGVMTLPPRKIWEHRESVVNALKKMGGPVADAAVRTIQTAADVIDPEGKSVIPRDFELTGEQKADAKKNLPDNLSIKQWADQYGQAYAQAQKAEADKAYTDPKQLVGRREIDPANASSPYIAPAEGALGQDLIDIHSAFKDGRLDQFSNEKRVLREGMQNLSDLREKEIELNAARIEKIRDDEMMRRQEENRIGSIQESSVRRMITEAQNIPDFWADASTPKKILAGIALTVGSLGAGMGPMGGAISGGASIIVDQLINKELERQKLRYNQAQSLSQQVSNWYGHKRATFQNERMADQAWLDDMYGLAENKIEAMKTQTDDQNKLAAFDRISQEISDKALANRMQLKKLGMELWQQDRDVRFSRIANIPEDTPVADLPEKLRQRYIPGVGFINDAKDTADIKKSIASTKSMEGIIDRLVTYADKYQWSPHRKINRVDVARAGADVAKLKALIRIEVTGGGNISEYEQKILASIAKNPLNAFTLGIANKAALESLKNASLRNLKMKLDTYGYQAWGNRSLLKDLTPLQAKGENMRTFNQDQFDQFFGGPGLTARR